MRTKILEQKLKTSFYKVSRNFIFEIGQNLANINSCGLYLYLFLICNVSNEFAKVEMLKPELLTRSSFKTEIELIHQLNHLKELQLIDFDANMIILKPIKRKSSENDFKYVLSSDISISLKSNATIKQNKHFKGKSISRDINRHSGFVLVTGKDIEIILASTKNRSECDMACDLFLNTIYNDDNITQSLEYPIVILNRYRISTSITYVEMSLRWECSQGRIAKVLEKLSSKDLIVRDESTSKKVTQLICKSFLN